MSTALEKHRPISLHPETIATTPTQLSRRDTKLLIPPLYRFEKSTYDWCAGILRLLESTLNGKCGRPIMISRSSVVDPAAC